jgi:dipeptidase
MGEFVEQLGYTASGRTYIIADPQEAWLFSAVAGKHWVAQRVPEDEVAFIPNYYTIRQVDLSDTDNFLACPDLIEHAIDNGWYNPASGPFDFAKVYNTASTQASLGNKLRHWGALRLLTGIEYPDMSDLPFSVKPNRQLSVEDITEVLRCHYEGTEWQWYPELGYSSPHSYRIAGNSIRVICTSTTQESFVMQLRSYMPSIIGNVYWRAQCRPCESVYIPWYSGILEVAEPYTIGEPGVPDDPESAYWTFQKMCLLVDADYADRIGKVRATWDNFENAEFARQAGIEKAALSMYYDGGKEDLARKFLTQYTEGLALKAFRTAGKLIDSLEK